MATFDRFSTLLVSVPRRSVYALSPWNPPLRLIGLTRPGLVPWLAWDLPVPDAWLGSGVDLGDAGLAFSAGGGILVVQGAVLEPRPP